MKEQLYFTKEQENDLRMLPRWAKAFIAARTARRAIELIDGTIAGPNFIEVVKTLDEVEKSIEEGKNVDLRSGDISPARNYADSLQKTFGHKNNTPDYYAALAVDDAYGLVTSIATTGRGREGADDYQLRKISFAIGCAMQASYGAKMMSDLQKTLYKDFELLKRAVKNRGISGDEQPVPRSILALHCNIDHSDKLVEISSVINSRLISMLNENPRKLYELEPRAFEELIAHLFDDFGYDVELTPKLSGFEAEPHFITQNILLKQQF